MNVIQENKEWLSVGVSSHVRKLLNSLYILIAVLAIIGGFFLTYQAIFGNSLFFGLLFIQSISSVAFGIFTLYMIYSDSK